MLKDTLVYISGAITAKNGHSIEENVAKGIKTFIALTKMGIPSFSPHAIASFPSTQAVHYSIWMAYDLAVIDHCTHMLMLPLWEESPGSVQERSHAEILGIPIVYSIHELALLLDVKE